jgi:hypothetical protein
MGTRHRRHGCLLVVAALIVSVAHAAHAGSKGGAAAKGAAGPNPEVVASSFQTFCEEWMHKLAERERDNVSHLKWEHVADGVQGSYTGYEQQHTCKLIDGTEGDPVAKVFYREVRYTKHGPTVAEAEQSPPKPVEIFEVQEIFHYLKGKWDY